MFRRRNSPPSAAKPKRDFWDKADIFAKFLSSVIIAIIGLSITWSIQKAQIETNENIAKAQLEAARLKTADDKRLQEGQITVQLLNHLISNNGTQRQIAVVALRQSVPAGTYESIVQILARNDENPLVRATAIQQLATAQSAQVKDTLTAIASDPSRPVKERDLAGQSSTRVALNVGSDQKTFTFLATSPGQDALESTGVGGGLFTAALVASLSEDLGKSPRNVITANFLARSINVRLTNLSAGRQTSSFSSSGSADTVFSVRSGSEERARALVIGVSNYQDRMLSLKYAAKDAERVATVLKQFGFSVTLLIDPTRENIRSALRSESQSATDGTFVLFFAGQSAASSSPSVTGWLAVDSTQAPSSWLPIDEVQTVINSSKAKSKWLFIDASYSRELAQR